MLERVFNRKNISEDRQMWLEWNIQFWEYKFESEYFCRKFKRDNEKYVLLKTIVINLDIKKLWQMIHYL